MSIIKSENHIFDTQKCVGMHMKNRDFFIHDEIFNGYMITPNGEYPIFGYWESQAKEVKDYIFSIWDKDEVFVLPEMRSRTRADRDKSKRIVLIKQIDNLSVYRETKSGYDNLIVYIDNEDSPEKTVSYTTAFYYDPDQPSFSSLESFLTTSGVSHAHALDIIREYKKHLQPKSTNKNPLRTVRLRLFGDKNVKINL